MARFLNTSSEKGYVKTLYRLARRNVKKAYKKKIKQSVDGGERAVYYSRMIKNVLKWTEGNAKLVKTSGESYRILGYGIPADHNFTINGEQVNTCPSASACKGVCYAKQGRYIMSNVKSARLHNLQFFIDNGAESFLSAAIVDLSRLTKRYNVVRVHDSGDFFSKEYVQVWHSIARAFPNVIFYAYTKSHDLKPLDNAPVNFRIVQSVGGMNDHLIDLSKPHARIFSTDQDRINAGYVDGNASDLPAIAGETKIGLVYHGVKKLTEAQQNYFK
jgi:hypothetical protein